MQLLSRYKKGIRFLLCAIDIFSKYAWVVPLKDKTGISIVKAFQIIYGSIKGLNFTMLLLKNGWKIMILLCIQHIMKENLLLLNDLLER